MGFFSRKQKESESQAKQRESLPHVKAASHAKRKFSSLEECLKSDDAEIGEKFEYALKELAEPIESILNPRMKEAGDALLGAPDYLQMDVARIIIVLTKSRGGITVTEARVFSDIMKKLKPGLFRNLGPMECLTALEEFGEDIDDELYIPDTLESLKEYDRLHGKKKTVLLASLFCGLILEISEGYEDLASVLLTSTYIAMMGEFMPNPSAEVRSDNMQMQYDLLGLEVGCSETEFKSAYKLKVSEWHPDKLQNMAPELQRFATERLQAINHAYEQLSQMVFLRPASRD